MEKSDKTFLKSISDQRTIVYQNEQKKKSKYQCSVSRLICIQLLVLLALLVLAAILIPIVVLVYDNQDSTSPCSTTYTGTFISGVTPITQCNDWRTFTTSLTCTSYSKLRLYGSSDPIGITITDTNIVTVIAIALRFNTTLITFSNGINWRVGSCGSGFEIAANGPCTCSSTYVLRPCQGSSSWGGIATSSCGAPTQTISLHFE